MFLLGCFFGAVQYFFYVWYTVRVHCTYRGTSRRVRRILVAKSRWLLTRTVGLVGKFCSEIQIRIGE